MVRNWSINFDRVLPFVAVVLVGLSILHPGRYSREVSSLRASFSELQSEHTTLRSDLVSVVQFLRDYGSLSGGSDGDDAGPSGVAAVEPADALDCSYMRVGCLDGVRRGADWWLVGDATPWGVLDASFRGGFIADGRRFRMVSKGLSNEL